VAAEAEGAALAVQVAEAVLVQVDQEGPVLLVDPGIVV